MANRRLILLRAINVGGRNIVPMAELRAALSDRGYAEVATYIQSGNVAVTSDEPVQPDDISSLLEEEFGVDVPVIVVDADDVRAIAEANPFVGEVDDLSALHVFFLGTAIDPSAAQIPDEGRFAPDRWLVAEMAVYVHYANGAGKSKLTNKVIEKALGVTATARNMKTVAKLLDL